MENYFSKFREGIIGINHTIPTPNNLKKIVYADWTASGRNYKPIENRIQQEIMPFVANTHTEASSTGMAMTYAYKMAKKIIKEHVNTNDKDIIISSNSGMTGVVNKFQRILGLKIHEKYISSIDENKYDKPVVFITHMEHHSNQTSWLETIADVVIINPTSNGLVDTDHLQILLQKYKSRKLKIASITSCSNVTGVFTPYHEIAKIMHKHGGYCFVDFSSSAPYIDINMHPKEKNAHLDAIFFSPHKFLGGPGSSGILIFNSKLYKNKIPDHPGGGTVDWTNPWGKHKYIKNIEELEDGGTPGFLQTIKAAMCITLKEEMGTENILRREKELLNILWNKLSSIKNLHILAKQHKERLGIISFYIDDLPYNLGVKILNDKFGIQSRGGCSCSGTYGHFLLNINETKSNEITSKIDNGDYSVKPGWIRISIHPTNTNSEIEYIADSVLKLAKNHILWKNEYYFDTTTGDINSKKNEVEKVIQEKIERSLKNQFTTPQAILNMV